VLRNQSGIRKDLHHFGGAPTRCGYGSGGSGSERDGKVDSQTVTVSYYSHVLYNDNLYHKKSEAGAASTFLFGVALQHSN
jgi:hypothetical protein